MKEMRHSTTALRLIAVLVTMVATTAAQQGPKPPDLPDAPVARQESTPPKRQNHFNTTIEVLERGRFFFLILPPAKAPLSSKQKFELLRMRASLLPVFSVPPLARGSVKRAIR